MALLFGIATYNVALICILSVGLPLIAVQYFTRRRWIATISDFIFSAGMAALGATIAGSLGKFMLALGIAGVIWNVITHLIWRPKYMRDADAAYYRD